MKEIIEKRRTHCKVFDLGGRKRKVRVSRAPLHYVRDGKLVDIDTTPQVSGRLLEVSEAPYRLKIDPERPAYLYTTETGRQVEVELVEIGGKPVNARGGGQEAGTVRWRGVAPQTDAAFRPLRKGIEALVVLYGPEAPRTWKWRVRGDTNLLIPPTGHDAKGRRLELRGSLDGGVLSIEWTGRVTNQAMLRRKKGWSEEVTWPVVVDPSVNEAIINGGDDAGTLRAAGGGFSTFSAGHSTVPAGCNAYGPYLVYAYAGFRFQTVAIPQGATISGATITVDILSISGSPNLNVYADDVDDAPAWSEGSRVRTITKTAAFTTITPSGTGLYTIGVTGIMQEIVNRAGWASGNDVRFGLFDNVGSGSNNVVMAALEHATRTEAQLEIEYEEAGGAAVAPKMMHYRRLRI